MNVAPSGFIDSLRDLADGLLTSVQDRVRLVGVELAEEKLRLLQAVVWIGAAIAIGTLALTMMSFTLVYLFWDAARTTVLVALSVFYGVLFVATLLWIRHMLARQPMPLAGTLEEIAEDRRCIRPTR